MTRNDQFDMTITKRSYSDRPRRTRSLSDTGLWQQPLRAARFWRVLGGWFAVAMCLGFGLPRANAQLTGSGDPGEPEMRAVVNFSALAELQKSYGDGLTRTNRRSLHAPLPRATLTNSAIPGPGAGGSGGGGGGAGAVVPPADPFQAAALPLPSPSPTIDFNAVDDNQTVIPPDTHGAVGPNHVMTVLNSQVRIQNRTGGIISTVDLDTFWQTLGAPSCFDPKLLYDPYAGRWIFTAMADAQSTRSGVLIGVSQTTDPTAGWYISRVKADRNNLSWADYPSLGFNKDWIVVSVNMFPIFFGTGLGFDGVNLFVFNKTNLYASGTAQFTMLRDGSTIGFTIVPAITYDPNISVMHLVEVDDLFHSYSSSTRRLRLSTITGPIGRETLTLASAYTAPTNEWGSSEPFIQTFLFGGFAPQLGSFEKISTGDARIQNVVYRNGWLWCAHTVFLPANNPTHTAIQWWQVGTNGAALQFGRIEDTSSGSFYAYPTIMVNRNDDALLGFSKFSPFQFASGNYAYRACADPLNTFRTDTTLKAGEGPYSKLFFFGFENRWGDYSSTVVDPINDLDFWTIQSYAAAPTNIAGFPIGSWGTWWGKVLPVESCQKIEFQYALFNVNEASPGFATISVLNIGGAPGTVDFATSDGTGIAGQDYLARSGTITFAAGQTETNFIVVILDNAVVNSNKTVELTLFNPTGVAVLGRTAQAILVIEDDETQAFQSVAGEFNFSTFLNGGTFFLATEYETLIAPCGDAPYTIINAPDRSAPGVLVTVTRTGGSTGRVLVDYETAEGGSAVPFLDYEPVQGTLVFDDHQMSTNFLVEVFPEFFFSLTTNLFFSQRFIRVVLSNARPAPEEEAESPGTVRPTLGLGKESGISVAGLGGFTNGWVLFERHNWRFDEYTSPTQVGGYRIFNVQLYNPGGLAGQIILRTRQFPDGGWGEYIMSTNFLMAGSDFAEAPANGGLTGFEVWPNPIYTDPALTTVTNFADYLATNVTLTFVQGECRKNFTMVITNDPTVEFNEDIMVLLIGVRGSPIQPHPFARIANVTITFNSQPAGAVDREWNIYNVAASDPPFNRLPGTDGLVRSLAVQPDGKTVLGGDFIHVNSYRFPGLARMLPNGAVDQFFEIGEGVNGFISTVLLYPTNSPNVGKILVAGSFSSFNGQTRRSIARLFPNGQLDTSFEPGNGANGPIWSMALQSDEKVVVGGAFDEFNEFTRINVARLNTDGSIDPSFDPLAGADGTVRAVGVSPVPGDGDRIVLGGEFVTYNTLFSPGIVRLNPDGSMDPNFETGGGVNGPVLALAVQADGKVMVGGSFSEINARSRINLARFNADGSLDLNFNPGFGTDGPIYGLSLQPDGKALIGGPFTQFNGTRRMGFARLRLNGTLDTSFLDTGYNQFAGLPKTLSFEPPNFAMALAVQPDGNIMVGGSFTNIGGNPSFRSPLRNDWTVFTRADKQVRWNIARVLGGATPGPGNAEYESNEYFVNENADLASVQLQRTDGRLGSLIAFAEAFDRVAITNVDYTVTNRANVWREAVLSAPRVDNAPIHIGQVSPAYFRIPILNDSLREGDETVGLNFVRPGGSIILGGEHIPLGGALGRAEAVLNIADDDQDYGVINFANSYNPTNENAGTNLITIIRTNGSFGSVSVTLMTRLSPITPVATANFDYRPVFVPITFNTGETSKVVRISIIDDGDVEFDENVELVLTNALGGAKLTGGTPTSITTALMTIIDNDYPPGRLNFAATTFTTNENAVLATIAVTRLGGSFGDVTVSYATSDGTATSPADYAATTGTLNWRNLESGARTFTIPLALDGIVDASRLESVNMRLFNPRSGTVSDPKLMGIRTNAVLQIEDSDAYGTLAFSQPFYQADENGGVTTITVVRHDGASGTVSANYSVTPTDPLSPGRDYVATGGTLSFGPGESSKSFNITLLDDTESDGNKALILTLAGAVNASLGTPNPVTLTLIDNESFNVRAGELDTAFRADTQTDGPIYALGLQADGRIVVAGEFAQVDNVTRTRIARLRSDGALDASLDPAAGPNGTVRTMLIQPDNKILLGGFFTQYNGTNRGSITRINPDGTLDSQFLPGSGANNPVYALALQPDNKVLVGGSFSTFDSLVPARPGIVRLQTNGIIDLSFNTGGGPDNAVYAVAVQTDGKILIGGEFLAVDGQPRTRLARLNRNGSLDNSFFTQVLNGAVRTLLVQPDGKIVAGGSFTTVGAVTRRYLARFNSDGSLDGTFLAAPLLGGDSVVLTVMQQVDGRLLVAGDFRTFNGVTRNRLTRLNSDGSTDSTINFGAGANSFVAALAVQPDREILLGGGFTRFDDQARAHIARIHGGAIAGPGAIEFSRAEFLAQENGTNAVITMRRRFGTTGAISVQYQTLDGTATAGVHYQTTTGTATFADGETQYSFLVPVTDNSIVSSDLFFGLQLDGNTFTGGATNGPQPIALVLILDDEGSISFASGTFNVGENSPSGLATIVVARHGGTNTTASVRFATSNGSALAGSDYISTNGTMTFFPGETAKTFHVRLINDTNVEPNETVQLTLSNPNGSNVLGIASATLLIVEDDFASGRFIWSTSTYDALEGDTNVVVTVLRTNGSSGVVSVRVRTLENTAVGGSDYVPYDNVLTFAEGDIAKTINIPIVDDLLVETDETFDLRLSEANGGASLGSLTNAQVRILNDDNTFIRPAGVTLISESVSTNGIIDPNETVTMGLALRNVGSGDTIDLVGTLLSGNGVTPLSGPQHYGVLQANGPAVSRPFTFLASGIPGDRIVATLLLTDTGSTNGSAPFPFTIGGQASRGFVSTNRITIVDVSPASPYPSTINVSGMGGTITKVSATLSNLTHGYPLDLDIMLVGPAGEKVILISDAGGTASSPNPLSNVNLTFDMAGGVLPATTRINSGSYRPSNYAGIGTADAFPPPAPPMPYTNVDLSVFNGASPNGNWSLYVVDDTSGANGSISGWSLAIQTADPVAPTPSFTQADLSIRTASSSGPVLVGANVANSISVSNNGPSTASTVGLISQIPSGLQLLNASSTSGTWKLVNRTLTWRIPSLPSGGSVTLNLTSQANEVGTQVNPLTAAANEMDPNPANNSANLVTTVISMPELQMTRSVNSVRLTWVGDASFVLQVCDRLGGTWNDVPDAPTVTGAERTIVQGVAPGSPGRFYRLRTQ